MKLRNLFRDLDEFLAEDSVLDFDVSLTKEEVVLSVPMGQVGLLRAESGLKAIQTAGVSKCHVTIGQDGQGNILLGHFLKSSQKEDEMSAFRSFLELERLQFPELPKLDLRSFSFVEITNESRNERDKKMLCVTVDKKGNATRSYGDIEYIFHEITSSSCHIQKAVSFLLTPY